MKWLYLGAVLGALSGLSLNYQEAQRVAYQAYEACVESEYGVLPSTFYVVNGYTPDCDY